MTELFLYKEDNFSCLWTILHFEGAAFTGCETGEYVLPLPCPKLDLCTVWIDADGDKEQKKRQILKTRSRKHL